MFPRTIVVLLTVACVSAGAGRKTSSYQPEKCTKKCSANEVCEIQSCAVCVPAAPTCNTIECKDNERCEDTPNGPVCTRLSCADIKCADHEYCKDTPDGPDCVADVPSCDGFFCPRGTNCYIRGGEPICLPNTCEVRVCTHGLTCIDTPNGALCRRGNKRRGCKDKYCPVNSKCEEKSGDAQCVKI